MADLIPNQGAKTYTPGTATQTGPAAYYQSVTVQGDSNLVAANILSGVNIFGVAGSAITEPWASGTVTSASSTISMKNSGGTSSNYYYVTVTGLSFTPKRIMILNPVSSANIVLTVYDADDVLQANPTACHVAYSTNGIQQDSNCYVNSGGFQLPVNLGSSNYKWYAYA